MRHGHRLKHLCAYARASAGSSLKRLVRLIALISRIHEGTASRAKSQETSTRTPTLGVETEPGHATRHSGRPSQPAGLQSIRSGPLARGSLPTPLDLLLNLGVLLHETLAKKTSNETHAMSNIQY